MLDIELTWQDILVPVLALSSSMATSLALTFVHLWTGCLQDLYSEEPTRIVSSYSIGVTSACTVP